MYFSLGVSSRNHFYIKTRVYNPFETCEVRPCVCLINIIRSVLKMRFVFMKQGISCGKFAHAHEAPPPLSLK